MSESEKEALITKPPQRPHHWMNADGTCHAGDLFEAGTPAMPLYAFDQMEAWVRAERDALRQTSEHVPRCNAKCDERGHYLTRVLPPEEGAS